MRTHFWVLAIALIATTMLFPGTADASHSWANYHWERSANPVELSIGDNVSTAWDQSLAIAVADWDQSTVLDLSVVSGSARRGCRAQSGRIEVCNDFYGNNGWLGLATISVSGDHITSGSALMNDTYFSVPPFNTDAWRQLVMCQEIGHVFGLAHQDEDFTNPSLGTCMDYTSDPLSQADQHPNQHDYEQLEAIYGHLDSGSGGGGGGGNCPPRRPNCSAFNNGVAGSQLDAPRDWGRLVRSRGRTAVYERHFGNDERIVTFVIFAD